jgi:hypothetical protein
MHEIQSKHWTQSASSRRLGISGLSSEHFASSSIVSKCLSRMVFRVPMILALECTPSTCTREIAQRFISPRTSLLMELILTSGSMASLGLVSLAAST